MSVMYPEKPLSLVVIYGLALGAVYKASQRGLTVCLGNEAVLMIETHQETST